MTKYSHPGTLAEIAGHKTGGSTAGTQRYNYFFLGIQIQK